MISIDERGFGESSGTVRVMSPDFEGRDLIAVLDWAEDLEGLRRRGNGKMMVGSYGGSYGGMYQLLLYSADPAHRLRVLAPDITPHDLNYSLYPNGVVKTGWGLALVGAGEVPILGLAQGGDPQTAINQILGLAERAQLRQDPVLYEALVGAATSSRFSDSAVNFFNYHSFEYFCANQPAGMQTFAFGNADPMQVPPTTPPAADVLLSQGMRDTLFNFNDAMGNYQCLRRLGGDVRLMTHESGHILPLSLGTAGLEDPLDAFYAALTLPGFQDGGGDTDCGHVALEDARFAWFEAKLADRPGALHVRVPVGLHRRHTVDLVARAGGEAVPAAG